MSDRDLKIAAATGVAIAAAVIVVAMGMMGGRSRSEASPAPEATSSATVPVTETATTQLATVPAPAPPQPVRHHHRTNPVPTLRVPPATGPAYAVVRLAKGAAVPVYSRPGGRLLTTLRDQTEFDSARTFSVVQARGSWFGVIAPELQNHVLGWVRYSPAAMERYWTKYSLDADLSSRSLTLSYGDNAVASYVVTVGGPGSETPTGRFAVTDGLDFGYESADYGCCAIVTSGHQPSLPPGWLGGDRIAIHGTLGPVGEAASHGCLRATDATLHALMARVPLGTPVFIHG